jgi:hypothetical protein
MNVELRQTSDTEYEVIYQGRYIGDVWLEDDLEVWGAEHVWSKETGSDFVDRDSAVKWMVDTEKQYL